MEEKTNILFLEDTQENRTETGRIQGFSIDMTDECIKCTFLESIRLGELSGLHPNDDNRALADAMVSGELDEDYVADILSWYQGGCQCPLTPMDIYEYFPESFHETGGFELPSNDAGLHILARFLYSMGIRKLN